jgi:multidrug resistance efflux pump
MIIREMKKTVFLVLIPVLAGCGSSNEKNDKGLIDNSVDTFLVEVSQVVGVGKAEPEKEIVSLAAATGGIVMEIYHDDGDSIKKGEPLVRPDDELENINVAQYKSQYLSQRAQKEMEELNLRDSEVQLANKERLLKSVKGLVDKGAETRQNLDDLETEVTGLRLTVDRNRASVSLAESRLNETAQQLRYAEAEAGRKTLRSPYDGILLDMQVEAGQAVSQYESYAEVAPSGAMTVRAEVDELFADRLKDGLEAQIRFVGSDSTVARGQVFFVSPYLKKKSLFSDRASEQEDRLVREVRIKLDGTNNLILNSKVEAVIKLKESQP